MPKYVYHVDTKKCVLVAPPHMDQMYQPDCDEYSHVIVVLACLVEQINVVGVLIGLLLVQPAAYITNFITANKEK